MSTAPGDKPPTTGSKERPWTPRFWDGMGIRTWLSLVARNRAAISPSRIPMAMAVTTVSTINSLLGIAQWAILGRKIARTEIHDDPIFVIGHWRSGTTLLHELLVLDERHTYSDTYACFAPTHFLVSGWFFRPRCEVLLPSRRPMDNMAAGWDRPQEDEFALCNMGGRSPYLTIAFPNRPAAGPGVFRLERLSAAGPRALEAADGVVPQVHHGAMPEADRLEVAAATPSASRPCWNSFPTPASSTSSAIPT